MKTGKTLSGYFKKRTVAIEALMKKPPGKFSAGDFHRLRVETKKLMAIVSILKFSGGNHKLNKKLKPLRNIFSQAGKVRALQLEISLIHQYDPHRMLKTYQRTLQNKEGQEKRKFSVLHQKEKVKLKKLFAYIISDILKTRNKDVKEYMDQKKNKISLLLKQKKLKTSRLHKLRKALKTIYYNNKSLNLKYTGSTIKESNELQEAMGKWHDCTVMVMHLSKAAGNRMIPLRERKRIMKIAGQLDSKSEMLLKKINSAKQKLDF